MRGRVGKNALLMLRRMRSGEVLLRSEESGPTDLSW